jgi:hypothetical protein
MCRGHKGMPAAGSQIAIRGMCRSQITQHKFQGSHFTFGVAMPCVCALFLVE